MTSGPTASLTPGVPQAYRISAVVEVELSRPLPGLSPGDHDGHDTALVVARLAGEPVGMTLTELPVTPDELAAQLDKELSALVDAVLIRRGTAARMLTADGITLDADADADDADGAETTATATGNTAARPPITVVVCTRNRPADLRRCLESVALIDYADVEVIVVDNAPDDDSTRLVCVDLADAFDLRYIREPVPGLSRARNTAVRHAHHSIVAFLDDDERADPGWLTGLAAEFADPRVGVVSGLVLPAELDTIAQVQFEQFGGHSKGRGFRRTVFDAAYLADEQSALYPLPPFGVGANMAFRRHTLADIRGFDLALGAGTRTGGGEDTAAFTEALLAGWTMVYTPDALTWHYHRRDDEALDDQLSGYAVGLGAYYTALVLRDPRRLGRLAALAIPAVRELIARDRPTGEPHADGACAADAAVPHPRVGAGTKLRGIARGPMEYTRARIDARNRTRRSTS